MIAYADRHLSCWRRIGFLPKLRFSDCGTFTYIEQFASRQDWWAQKVSQLDIGPLSCRCIHISWVLDNFLVIFHDSDNTSLIFELIKFDDNGFWRSMRPAVLLRNIAFYSSHFVAADRYLLLGANDDERMRLLIAPHDERTPVIKTLSLTFAEARSRLEEEWQRLRVESHDQGLGNTIGTGSD